MKFSSVPAHSSAPDGNSLQSSPHVAVRITNRHGRCNIYRAENVLLTMRQGILRLIESEGRCYVHLDRCSILVKDTRETPLFQLNHSPALDARYSDLTIIAALDDLAES